MKNATMDFLAVHEANDVEAIGFQLAETGIAFLRGLDNNEELLRFGRQFGEVFMHRDADRDGITQIGARKEDSGKPGFQGFSTLKLDLHTDRSALNQPPSLLLMACKKKAPRGGVSLFTDGQAILEQLMAKAPHLAALLSEDDAAFFEDSQNSYRGPVFQLLSKQRYQVRLRTDEGGRFHPKVVPLMPSFFTLLSENMFRRLLDPGEAVILNNTRWLHGRSEFTGPRMILRLLLDNEKFRGFNLVGGEF